MDHVLVHKNTSLHFYESAQSGEIALYYDPVGGQRLEDVGPDGDRVSHFWVPPEKAMRLREMILAGKSSEDILAELRLHRNSIENVDFIFEQQEKSARSSQNSSKGYLRPAIGGLSPEDYRRAQFNKRWNTMLHRIGYGHLAGRRR